jgi:transposase
MLVCTLKRTTKRVSTKAPKRSRYSGTSVKTPSATTAFNSPVARNTCGTVKLKASNAPAPTALTMMNNAFRMLLAAMMRAR